jgi:LPXTG-motif cell wall-anchored protein
VAQLKSTGIRTEPEAGTAWSPFCAALTGVGGSCLLGGVVSGATAMVSQRLIAEGQALFVTPASCLPEGLGQLELATETGKVAVPAALLTAAQCDRWQAPVQPAAPKPSTGWIAAAGALLVAGAVALFVRRRRAAAADQRG